MTRWERAQLAITLLAIDPQRLGGLGHSRPRRPSSGRNACRCSIARYPTVKLQHHMTLEVLNGDIDLTGLLGGAPIGDAQKYL